MIMTANSYDAILELIRDRFMSVYDITKTLQASNWDISYQEVSRRVDKLYFEGKLDHKVEFVRALSGPTESRYRVKKESTNEL